MNKLGYSFLFRTSLLSALCVVGLKWHGVPFAYADEAAKTKSWQIDMVSAEFDVKKGNFEQARAKLLKAASEASKAIPGLLGHGDKKLREDLNRLNVDFADLTKLRFVAQTAQSQSTPSKTRQVLLSLMLKSEEEYKQLLALDEKWAGKSDPSVVGLRKSLSNTQATIAKLSAVK